jgi:DNA-binding LacI/PurR family transcriptional regulator
VAAQARDASRTARHKVTINDVARAAGVSRQTVSNVLNGSGRVGAAARARVLAVVAELGYQPHHGARSLRSRRTMQLGYLMPGIQFQPADPIMAQFLHALVAAGAQRRYRVVMAARPDAVVTGSDKIAAVVYGVAAELNLRVGRDLAVTGFGGSVSPGLLYPQLTTVVIPVADLAQRIVGRALRQLDHGPDAGPGELVPAPLRPAASTQARPAGAG